METNKIKEWDKLQIKKIRLKAEAEARVQALDEHLDYLQGNMGHLLMGSAVSSVKSKMPPFIQNLFPSVSGGSSSGIEPQSQYPSHQPSKTGAVVGQIIELIPLIFKGTKPVLAAFLLRKAKDMIFSKKKKK